jgi:hypothetical protein
MRISWNILSVDDMHTVPAREGNDNQHRRFNVLTALGKSQGIPQKAGAFILSECERAWISTTCEQTLLFDLLCLS